MAMMHPVFDIEGALAHLMNNKKLYEKLLTRFEKEYSEYDKLVRVALESGNYDEAMLHSHTMKGLAGNLGAERLREASQAVESLCKERASLQDFETHLALFSQELATAIQAVRDGVDLG